MDIYIFDMDGTLTLSRQQMSKDFYKSFLPWLKTHIAYLAAGSNYEKVTEQLPPDVVNSFSGIYSSMGNVFHKKGKEIYKKEIFLEKEMLKALEQFRKNTKYDGKLYTNYMELRPGMLNFSILGRNCPFSEREKYHNWDKENSERAQISKELNEKFPNYEFSLGGKISIDIVTKGYGKEQVAHEIRKAYPNAKIIFIGDRIMPGGNDYNIATTLKNMENTEVVGVNSPDDVLTYLNI
jgi:phosphomannomutase